MDQVKAYTLRYRVCSGTVNPTNVVVFIPTGQVTTIGPEYGPEGLEYLRGIERNARSFGHDIIGITEE